MAGELLQFDVGGFLVSPSPITFHLFELQCVLHILSCHPLRMMHTAHMMTIKSVSNTYLIA